MEIDCGPLPLSVTANTTRPLVTESSIFTSPRSSVVLGASTSLAARIASLRTHVLAMIERQDYTAALKLLANLRPEVDRFFDEVMVMTEDEQVRDNRLALLAQLEGKSGKTRLRLE